MPRTWWDDPQLFSTPNNGEMLIREGDKLFFKGPGDVIWRELRIDEQSVIPGAKGAGIFQFTDIVTTKTGEFTCTARTGILGYRNYGILCTVSPQATRFRRVELHRLRSQQEPVLLFSQGPGTLVHFSRWCQGGESTVHRLSVVTDLNHPNQNVVHVKDMRVVAVRPKLVVETSTNNRLELPIPGQKGDAIWEGRKLTRLSLEDFTFRYSRTGEVESILPKR